MPHKSDIHTRLFRLAVCLLILLAAAVTVHAQVSVQVDEAERYWPQWRGPLSTGEAPLGNPPLRWSESNNIRWKYELPGLGHATPVVWGDRIFVLTAVPAVRESGSGPVDRLLGAMSSGETYRYEVLAIDRRDGSLIWRQVARVEPPHDGKHNDASWANCSPVTDGEHVIASFGSRGFFCFDMEGNLEWTKDFGDLRIRFSWGEGVSPALWGDKLIVTWDHVGRSFIVVLDKRTGEEIWRKDRDDGTSWASPLVVEHNGRTQVITSAIRKVRSYDLETGEIIWETRGMTPNPIPTPVPADGIVILMGGYRESILQAVSLDKAQGDASRSGAIVWEYGRDTPYVPSPLVYEGNVYFLKSNQNILSCFDAATGKEHYSRQRIEGLRGVYASPVAARDRIYIAGRNGTTAVIKPGPQYDVLAVNRLDDSFSASPVIVGNDLILRGHKYLYCISAPGGARGTNRP